MFRRIFIFCCVVITASTLSGCFGLIVSTPAECANETPFTGVHDIFRERPSPRRVTIFGVIPEVPTPRVSTKEEFLIEWGKPDEVIATSENEETWIYNKKLWCGAIPAFGLAVPLLLPVCDGFDRIIFQDNVAKRLHTRRIVSGGFMLIYTGGWGGMDPACQYPLVTEKVVVPDPEIPAAPPTPSEVPGHVDLSAERQFASVSLTIPDLVRAQAAAKNHTIDSEELLNRVNRALNANVSLHGPTDKPRLTLEIKLKDLRLRKDFEAVAFGFWSGADLLIADIVVKDMAGKELYRFEVTAWILRGGWPVNQERDRLGWLYEELAGKSVNELAIRQARLEQNSNGGNSSR